MARSADTPSRMAVATAIFAAGIGNAVVYTLGFLILVAIQFATKSGGAATFGAAMSAFVVTFIVSLLLSTLITFIVTAPIAFVCRAFGFTSFLAYLIAPVIGAAIVCAVASLLGVALSTYVAIVAFAYITAALMWLALGHPSARAGLRTDIEGEPA